jgi:2-iminobutanoate/2-iminopropanoate deaminase
MRKVGVKQMTKQCITVPSAPPAVGPYSHAVKAGTFLFISGQGPFNRDGSGVIHGSFSQQVEYTMENIRIILNNCGCDFSDVVKVTVFLTDMSLFPEFNEVYKKYFDKDFPARSCVGVSQLPAGIPVEIEVIAMCKD